jgi:ABC-2 type transport system ATP-binding protein
MIEVNNITKKYGTTVACDGATFDLHKGEVLGFLGPNGAGKTTTMRILTCFIKPDSGTATVAGHDILQDPLSVRKRIGYLPEDNPLYEDMLVREYLRFVAEIRGIGTGPNGAIARAVDVCGLHSVFRRPIGELSKGFRQRVGLAQALLHDPDILILDEPTSGLDPTQIVEIRGLIKRLGEEKTVILCTHILPEAQAACSRVIIINRGRIVTTGTPDELVAGTRRGTVIRMEAFAPGADIDATLTETPWVKSFERVEGEVTRYLIKGSEEPDVRERLFHLCVEKKWTLRELSMERVSLEDVFLELTTEENEG